MIHQIDSTTDYRVANVLFRNDGDGTFVDISAQSGSGLAVVESTRGVCADDLDNDGDQDLVMLNQESKPTLLQNATPPTCQHWLEIRLIGTTGNRDGVGSHVTVRAGDLVQLDEVHSGSGYQSHSGMRLHFGLADRPRVERIEVQWLGGGVDVLEDVAADQLVTIVQGTHPAPSGATVSRVRMSVVVWTRFRRRPSFVTVAWGNALVVLRKLFVREMIDWPKPFTVACAALTSGCGSAEDQLLAAV